MIRRAARLALALAALFATLDLWQLTVLQPGALGVRDVGILLALYVGAAFVAALAVLAVAALARRGDRAPVGAFLLSAGLFLVAQEVALRLLVWRSPWRPWVVLGLALVAVASVPLLARLLRRDRMPRWAAAVSVVLLALGAFGAVGGFGVREAARRGAAPAGGARPDVLLITIDTLRADHLGCYGYRRATSPVLDAFAREGALFAHDYAQSSWTKPSTASLLTSHYPTMHGANQEKARIADGETLLSEVLHDAGYTTAVLSGNPWVTPEHGFDQGVDYFYSVYDDRFARLTLLMMTLKRVSLAVDRKNHVYNQVKRAVQGDLSTTERDVRLGEEAARWLGERRDGPVFTYMHMMSPHHPYDPPPPYDRTFNEHPVTPAVTAYPKKSYTLFETGDPLAPERLADMVARYDGDILFADTVLGKLFAQLRTSGVLDRTLVIITADHGEEFYDHQNWGHGHSMYNELLHVPLLVRYPPVVKPGTRRDETVMSVDVMPTVLELAGITPGPTLAGRSLVQLLRGEAWTQPAEAYSELLYRFQQARALLSGDKKLVTTSVDGKERELLYDLAADPLERHDLMTDHGDPRPYETRLAEIRTWAEQHRIDAAVAHVSDEMADKLNALGYVNH